MSKILIIEDDEFLKDLYFHTFSFSGYDVHIAKNGIEGVEQTKLIHPDLIYLDMMMPKMNGLEALRIIKSDESIKDIPVIILSNFSNAPQKDEAMALGALTYIIKSEFEPKAVVQLTKDVLAGTFVSRK